MEGGAEEDSASRLRDIPICWFPTTPVKSNFKNELHQQVEVSLLDSEMLSRCNPVNRGDLPEALMIQFERATAGSSSSNLDDIHGGSTMESYSKQDNMCDFYDWEDANSAQRPIARAVKSAVNKAVPSSSVPRTPKKNNQADQEQNFDMRYATSTSELPTGNNAGRSEIIDEILEPQGTELSSQVMDQLSASKSVQLQENNKLEKGTTDEPLFIKTPQQKPRRKKHRPKVIKENKPKKTPESNAEKTPAPQETVRTKRKSIQQKVLDDPLEENGKDVADGNDPTDADTKVQKRKYTRRKGINGSQGKPEKVGIELPCRVTRSSCRKSLNFDLDSQTRDQSTSGCLSTNCDTELQTEKLNEKDQPADLNSGHEMDLPSKKSNTGIPQKLQTMTNQVEENCQGDEQDFLGPSPYKYMISQKDLPDLKEQDARAIGKCQIVFSNSTHDKESDAIQAKTNCCVQTIENSRTDSFSTSLNTDAQVMELETNCCVQTIENRTDSFSTSLNADAQVMELERLESGVSVKSETCNRNESGVNYNSLQNYNDHLALAKNPQENACSQGHYPLHSYKRKSTEKANAWLTTSRQYISFAPDSDLKMYRQTQRDSFTKLLTSTMNLGTYGTQCEARDALRRTYARDSSQTGKQIFENLRGLDSRDMIQRQRSKCPTQDCDIASLLKASKELPASHKKAATMFRTEKNTENFHDPQMCMEALTSGTHSSKKAKKLSNRSLSVKSTGKNMNNQQVTPTCIPGMQLALTWNITVDTITEQLSQLDLCAEGKQAFIQNSVVQYQISGAVVPFEGFYIPEKRKQRPKVDLDDETTRVWRLLLENINSEGIDGTSEDKAKWWEEERRVFNGRANSFIARMHLVQGDRRFSPWKGSVVDSVVGVFLTQNVSDHLSSSAFMSLAARYPAASDTTKVFHEECYDSQIKLPEALELNPDVTSEMNKRISNDMIHGKGTETHRVSEKDENREVISVKSQGRNLNGCHQKDCQAEQSANASKYEQLQSLEAMASKPVGIIEDEGCIEETLSSQTTDISSQNSSDSPNAEPTERTGSCFSTPEEETIYGAKQDKYTSSLATILQRTSSILNGDQLKDSSHKFSDENGESQSSCLESNLHGGGHLGYCASPATHMASCSRSFWCDESISGTETRGQCLSGENIKYIDNMHKEHSNADVSGLTSESSLQTGSQTGKSSVSGELRHFCSNILSSKCNHNEANHKISRNQSVNIMDANGGSSYIDSDHREVNSNKRIDSEQKETTSNKRLSTYHANTVSDLKETVKTKKEKAAQVDWEELRRKVLAEGRESPRTFNTNDSVDWDAVRCADVNEVAQTIKDRGMNNVLAGRIKDFLNRLLQDHGSLDLEWLRDVPPDKAKEYLLSFRGLGLKSVECVRLLTLHHLAFPVDTNVGRIAVRLGWVPLQPLPESLQLHLLELYPVLESIQKYLWPRLCKLDQKTLYELHYQMITFGKVFCTKSKPNCNACPMRAECRHFASAYASARLALPAPEGKSEVNLTQNRKDDGPRGIINSLPLALLYADQSGNQFGVSNNEPIIEEPQTPEPIIEVPATPEPDHTRNQECGIDSIMNDDIEEIPTIELNMEDFNHNLQMIIQKNTELQEGDMSKALVALTAEEASIPVPKLKNVNRLRTEHRVYELPDSHPLLEKMDKREPDDPSPYLLAIWTPGETANSIEPPQRQCSSRVTEDLCNDETCSSCNSIREANSQTVRGTILIPCRTAMRGSFPLNGTYFQVNEVFTDHESSLSPINVPRECLWNLPRRTVYFGTSIPTIFKGLSTEGIQYCFWRGFVCVRGFDRKSRAPRPLIARLHFPASKLTKGKAKNEES